MSSVMVAVHARYFGGDGRDLNEIAAEQFKSVQTRYNEEKASISEPHLDLGRLQACLDDGPKKKLSTAVCTVKSRNGSRIKICAIT